MLFAENVFRVRRIIRYIGESRCGFAQPMFDARHGSDRSWLSGIFGDTAASRCSTAHPRREAPGLQACLAACEREVVADVSALMLPSQISVKPSFGCGHGLACHHRARIR